MAYVQAPGGEGEIYVPDEETAQSLRPTNTATPENQDSSKNSSVGPAPWQAGYDTLLKQMGALQNNTDVYKRGSPLSADRHMQNIAMSLAKDYGITNISDIGATPGVISKFANTVVQERGKAPYTVQNYDVGSDGVPRWNANAASRGFTPGEPVQQNLLDYKYYNKTTKQEIPGYKFASENEGDGYSEYNLQAVPDGKGGVIAVPIQNYSKSGMGAFVEDIGPALSVANAMLMAAGAPPVLVAAGNVALQAGAGNIHDIGDVLRTAAPAFVGDPGILGGAAKTYLAYSAFDKGDVIGGLSSLAGAAGMNGLSSELRLVNAIKKGDIPGALTTLASMSNVFNAPLKDDAGNILKNANGSVKTLGNMKIGGENGLTLSQLSKSASLTANLLSDNPNYGAALLMAGDLAKSYDTVVAGKALSLVQALESGNPSAIYNAARSFSTEVNGTVPRAAPIDNRTANAAVAAAAPDAAATVPQNLAGTDPLTTLTASDLVANNASGTQATPEQIAAVNLANNNGLLTTDLGIPLDTVNVSGSNPAFVNDDTLTYEDLNPVTPTNQLTSSQIAALTSGSLTSLTTSPANALAPVTVKGGGASIGLNDDMLADTDTTSPAQDTQLTSSQIAALTSGNVTALDTKNVRALDTVLVKGSSDMPANDDTLADTDTTSPVLDTQLTSAQIAALDTKNVRALDTVLVKGSSDMPANDDTLADTDTTTKDLTKLTSKDLSALTTTNFTLDPVTIRGTADLIGANDDTLPPFTTLTSGPVTITSSQVTSIIPTLTSGSTVLTSTQIPAVTSGPAVVTTSPSTVLTSTQVAALTTMSPKGLQALPTSDARYWRQTGAQGTGGKGGVRFFDWYDTPENRTMAPTTMASTNIPAITSQQAEAMVNPAKRYFNQSTNRYYTDPTGQWTPPAGWAQTTFKDGGDVNTKHFEEGDYVSGYVPEEETFGGFDTSGYDGRNYDLSTAYDLFGGVDSGSYNFNDSDLGMTDAGLSQGLDSSFGDRPEPPPGVGDFLHPATWDPYSQEWRVSDEEGNTVTYDKNGTLVRGEGVGFDKSGKAIQGKRQQLIAPGRNAGKVEGAKTLSLPSNISPNLRNALLAAGLGGLLGYVGRSKGMTPKGMQAGSLGLTQSQVYNALKGKPVQRAEGGEIDGYAKGGGLHYLKSAEDGMADKISATIDNKQPAKLSGGEFVIPADVVSHLGNGNSEAGAKRLYEMMDRIRHARTGTKKQGKQINPAKFTPK